ncbi:hypothetical protein AJ87_48090 [Rhizobium yanglingense]|nr:hypothetical protein AJ87_48090 [Rhizobium yanglingense]
MKEFSYLRASSADQAREAAARQGAMVIAGGTTLLDLAKCGIAAPETVVDITFLSGLDAISSTETGVTIGALAKMSAVAEHRVIKEAFPRSRNRCRWRHPPSFATWRRLVATSCSAPAVRISATRRSSRPATSASRVRDVRRSAE